MTEKTLVLEPLLEKESKNITGIPTKDYMLIFNAKKILDNVQLRQSIVPLINTFTNVSCPTTTIINIEKELGSGKYGVVYKASSKFLKKHFGNVSIVIKKQIVNIPKRHICADLFENNKIKMYDCKDWLSEIIIYTLTFKLLADCLSPNFLIFYGFYTCDIDKSNANNDNSAKSNSSHNSNAKSSVNHGIHTKSNGTRSNSTSVYYGARTKQKKKTVKNQYVVYSIIQAVDMTLGEYLSNNIEIASIKNSYSNFCRILSILLFQVFHSIYVMQKYYKMVHNDLHMNNILVSFITTEKYCNHNLSNVDYLVYKVENKIYRIPFHDKILAKITDFGYSATYGDPQIVPHIITKKKSLSIGLYDEFSANRDILFMFSTMMRILLPHIESMIKQSEQFTKIFEKIINATFNMKINFEKDYENSLIQMEELTINPNWYMSNKRPVLHTPYMTNPVLVLQSFDIFEVTDKNLIFEKNTLVVSK